jgi:hypothetical protein
MKVGADALQYLVLHVADKKTFLQYSQNTQHEQVYQNNKLILKKIYTKLVLRDYSLL